MCDGTRHPHDRLTLHGFLSLEVKLACDAAHCSTDVGSSELRVDSLTHSPHETRSSSSDTLREDRRPDSGTSVIAPTGAWGHCPIRNATAANGRNRRVLSSL